jgi:hypothetical protein
LLQVLVATDAETGEKDWRCPSNRGAGVGGGGGAHTFHVPRSLLAGGDSGLEERRYRAFLVCVGVALIVFPSVTVAACFFTEVLLHCWHHRLVRRGARRRDLPCLLQPMQQLVSAFCADCQVDRFYRTVDQKRRSRKLKNAEVLLKSTVS